MPLPSLLLLASAIAAAAFFLAGWLLVPRRAVPPPKLADAPAAPPATAPKQEVEQELEDLRRRLSVAEEERDQARAAEARLAEQEQTLARRLRVAEDANRDAFEREEKAAEAWAAELEAAKAGQKRHDQAQERQLEELRARLEARAEEETAAAERVRETEAERARLARALEDAEAAARAKLAEAEVDALAKVASLESAEQARLAEIETAARARVAELEAAQQTRLAEVEAASRARLSELEAALAAARAEAASTPQADDALAARERAEAALVELRARLATSEAALEELRARLAATDAERAELGRTLARELAARQAAEEARQELDLRRRAADEVVEVLRAQLGSAKETLRGAELAAKERDRLATENTELREQQATAARAASERAEHEDAVKDAKVELAAAQAKLAELEATTQENRRLRDEIVELRAHEDAAVELERLTAAHKQVRLDAELMARRLQELLHDRAELAPLRAQAADAAELAQEVEYLRRREKDLEAQLYAAGAYASREIMALSGELPLITPVTDLETNLTGLVGQGGARTAVLADGQGFLIASAGESVAEEGLAAFAAVAGDMVTRARQLLPLADIESVRVTDANRMVLTCHLFSSAGEPMGVATLGPADPPAEKTAQAIAGLAAIVAGNEASAEETPEPEPAA